MMKETAELANYLSLSFKTLNEQAYINAIWDSHQIGTRI